MTSRRYFNLFLSFLVFAFVLGTWTDAEARKRRGKRQGHRRVVRLAPLPPLEETARSYLLVDATTGDVLKSSNAQQALVPASLTKVMTLRLAMAALRDGRIHLHDQVRVTKNAWGGKRPLKGSSLMFLQQGAPVTVEQLIQGAAVASANDACVALAEHIGGTLPNFVQQMNLEAKRLGLASAVFHDPHGLSTQNRITAADMARLAMAMLRDYPEYLDYASQPFMTYRGITQYNHLRLLKQVEGADGFKTGYISTIGYNVVVTAKRGNRRLIAVVMGTPRRVNGHKGGRVRDQLAAKLINTGFSGFETIGSTNL